MNKYRFFNFKSNVNQKVACMLVGNKVDMSSKRAVTYQEGKALGILFIIQPINTGFCSFRPQRRQPRT